MRDIKLEDFVKNTCTNIFNGINSTSKEVQPIERENLQNFQKYKEDRIKGIVTINFDLDIITENDGSIRVNTSNQKITNTNLKFSVNINL